MDLLEEVQKSWEKFTPEEILFKYRKGIVYSYSEEIYQLFNLNFRKAIEMVDANSENNDDKD